MHSNKFATATLILFLLAVTFCAYVKGNTNSPSKADWSQMTSKERVQALVFITPAYCKEALRLIIEEANRVARELSLPKPRSVKKANSYQFSTKPRSVKKQIYQIP